MVKEIHVPVTARVSPSASSWGRAPANLCLKHGVANEAEALANPAHATRYTVVFDPQTAGGVPAASAATEGASGREYYRVVPILYIQISGMKVLEMCGKRPARAWKLFIATRVGIASVGDRTSHIDASNRLGLDTAQANLWLRCHDC